MTEVARRLLSRLGQMLGSLPRLTHLRRLVAFWALQVDVLATWRPGRVALLRRGLYSWLLGGLSLLLVDRIVAGFFVPDVPTAFLGALVIALLNALIRPIFVLL